jgi:phosphoglycerate kinase
MPDFLTLPDLNLRGKTVLLRADLNVPMKDGRVTDEERLTRLLPTLREISEAGAKIVILSHFGRPEGKPDPKLSLRPVATALENLWNRPVAFAEDCIGPKAEAAVKALPPGAVLVLENTRFHPGEEANDPDFAKQLAVLGDIYVNDAFSCAHRAHASTAGLAQFLPSAAGRLMQAELDALTKALSKPERPVAAVVGGSKIGTKLDLLNNLVAKVDVLILGGGMATTMLAAKGIAIGTSLNEPHLHDVARNIMKTAEERGCHIILQKDAVVAASMDPPIMTQIVDINKVPADKRIFDIGPASVQEIKNTLLICKTVVWNGPLGVFEVPPFDKATNEVAVFVADLTKRGKILSVAGGGDTASALANAGVVHGFSYISMAGGAFLEWLEGKVMPGVEALRAAVPKPKMGKVII